MLSQLYNEMIIAGKNAVASAICGTTLFVTVQNSWLKFFFFFLFVLSGYITTVQVIFPPLMINILIHHDMETFYCSYLC